MEQVEKPYRLAHITEAAPAIFVDFQRMVPTSHMAMYVLSDFSSLAERAKTWASLAKQRQLGVFVGICGAFRMISSSPDHWAAPFDSR
jgi:hypothetical protein